MAGRKRRFKAGEIIAAIVKANGIVTQAARILGCDRKTVYNYRDRYTSVSVAMDDANEGVIDIGEEMLMDIVKNPDHKDHFRAVRFLLRTKGKNRGFSDRREVTGKDGGPVAVVLDDAVVALARSEGANKVAAFRAAREAAKDQ